MGHQIINDSIRADITKLNHHLQAVVVVVQWLSRVQLPTPRTAALQAPPSTGLPRQGHWRRAPIPSQGILPDAAIEPRLLRCKQTLHCLSHQGSPALGRNSLK